MNIKTRIADAKQHLLQDISRHITYGDYDKIMDSVFEYRRLTNHLKNLDEGYNGIRGIDSEQLKANLEK